MSKVKIKEVRQQSADIASNHPKQYSKNFNTPSEVVVTIDPYLTNSESGNKMSRKAVQAKKIFSNYRKTQ